LLAGTTGYASAFEDLIPTKISLLKWGGNPRVEKLYKIVSKPVPDVTLPACNVDGIPTGGGSVTVTLDGNTLECNLPANAWGNPDGGWKMLGKCDPGKFKGYKYLNKGAPGNDPCKLVILKGNVIKVLAKSVGGIALPGGPGTNGDVGLSLTVGEGEYCALAEAPHFKEKAETLIKMKDQPVPMECPQPPIGAHKCVLAVDETTPANGSNVTVALQAGPFPTLPVSGSLDVICGQIDPITGIAPCECHIQELDPIDFSGLGFVCFSPSSGCQMGQIDCDGGDALNVDLTSDHIAGPCPGGNPECDALCTSYCAPGYVLNAGCEGFCNGGSNDGVPCVEDSECPGGACPGPLSLTHGSICNCDCVTVDGAPTLPGTVQCDLAASVEVDLAPTCGDGDVAISIGTQCIPMTAGTFTSITHNVNNTPGKDFPVGGSTSAGLPVGSCEDLSASMTTGLDLTGGANFYDTLIGDVSVSTRFVCQ